MKSDTHNKMPVNSRVDDVKNICRPGYKCIHMSNKTLNKDCVFIFWTADTGRN